MIISRHILHPNITFDGVDKSALSDMIDYWKVLLWEKFEMRPGEKIGITCTKAGPYYVSLLLASFELGLIVAVTNSLQSPLTDPMTTKQALYKDLKLCIYDDQQGTPHSIESNSKFFKILCNIDIFDLYQIRDNSLFNQLKTKLFPSPNDVALITTSSGTTGVPEVVTKTHEFLIKSSLRQIKVWEFDQNDKILHTRQISHGAVFDLFWLPALMACQHHISKVISYSSAADVDELHSTIQQQKINKLFLPSANDCDVFLTTCPVLVHELDIVNIGFIRPYWQKIIKEKNIHSMISSYGATELGNAIMINKCTPENSDSFVENRFYFADDSFSMVASDDTGTTFVNHFANGLTVKLKDRWQQVDNKNWDLLGRVYNYKINDVYITVDQLENIVKKYITVDHTVLIDQEYQSIYLAIYDEFDCHSINLINTDLEATIGVEIQINKFARLDKNLFQQGFKPDSFILRGHFRKI